MTTSRVDHQHTDSLSALDAVDSARLVRVGELSALELVDAAIARCEAARPLNAVIHEQFDRARVDARSLDAMRRKDPAAIEAPLAGVPFLLKDFGAFEAGEPHHRGMAALRKANYRATEDSAVAYRLRAAGVIPIGRTNVAELALMGTTEPEAFGPTHNPWDIARSPGGSSGGSGAAVAVGISPGAHANDIAGSIRIPAAHCGLVGLKPTRARFVTSFAADASVGMYCEGVLTRTVRDTAVLGDALADTRRVGPWPAPVMSGSLSQALQRDVGTLRIGLYPDLEGVDAHCAAAAHHVAALLESLGHHIELAAPSVLFSFEMANDLRSILAVHNAAELDRWSAVLGRELEERDVEANTWRIVTSGREVSGAALLQAMERVQLASRKGAEWWSEFDLLVTPTTAQPPTLLGEYTRDYRPGLASVFTRVFNATGQPAISLPLGWPEDGLPRGVQLVAAYGRDDLLISVAAGLEAAEPWGHRRPVLSVSSNP